MKKASHQVYQFKISLKGISPRIWRRIQVPGDYSFFDLHIAIQDAMGWQDYHLHEFTVYDPSTGSEPAIGIPMDGYEEGVGILPGWEFYITKYLSPENSLADYVYDFGDCWEHQVKLEKMLHREEGTGYPRCIGGKRACPPEDCGGVWGYEEFLQIIGDPGHEEHEEMLDWVSGSFDPEHFNAGDIRFRDPRKHWRISG